MTQPKRRPVKQEVPVSQQAELVAKFFRGLGDPTRVRIIQLLLKGPMTVSEIVKALGQPQGRVSSHLACLRWCGYVSGQQLGRHVHYRVTDPRVMEMLDLARSMLADHAANLEACTRIDGQCL
jgi:ArsR family transcriptional regulator